MFTFSSLMLTVTKPFWAILGQVPLNIVAFFCRQPSPYPCRGDALSPWRTKGNSPPLPLPVTSAERKMGFYVAQSLQTAGTDCKIGMTNKMEFRWISILRTHYDMSRLWDLKPSQNSGQSFLNHANNMAGLGLGFRITTMSSCQTTRDVQATHFSHSTTVS